VLNAVACWWRNERAGHGAALKCFRGRAAVTVSGRRGRRERGETAAETTGQSQSRRVGGALAALRRRHRHRPQELPRCGGALHMIGEDRTEPLDQVASRLRVRAVRHPRNACRTCDGGAVQAPASVRPIDSGMATETLVPKGVVSKFCDSIRLFARRKYRSARASRSTVRRRAAGWTRGRAASADL
jgi:transposase